MWNIDKLYEVPEVFPIEGFRSEGVQALYFSSVSFRGKDTRAFAWIGFPKNCEKQKVPGVVLVHGGGGTAYAEWVRIWNRKGYAAIAVSTTGKGGTETETPEQSKLGPHEWAGPTEEDKFRNIELPHEEHWTYHAVANVILANSLLMSYPQVDQQRIGVVGVSWGGYLTCIASSIDKRFQYAASAYGCGFIYADSYTFACDKVSEEGRRWIKLWDPSNYLCDNETPIFWFTGTNDKAYSLGILERSYNLVKGDLALLIEPEMSHSHVDAWKVREQYAFVESYLKGVGGRVKIHKPTLEDNELRLKYDFPYPINKAELIFTEDNCEKWQGRKWRSQEIVPGVSGEILAKLPQNVRHAFVNVTDHRGIKVSSKILHV